MKNDVTSKLKTVADIMSYNGLPSTELTITKMMMGDLALNLLETVVTVMAMATMTVTMTATVVTIQRVCQ